MAKECALISGKLPRPLASYSADRKFDVTAAYNVLKLVETKLKSF